MPPPLRAAAAHGISYRPIGEADLPFLFEVYASTRADELAITGWPDEMKHAFLAQQFEAQHVHYQRHYPDAEWLVIEREGEGIGRLYIEAWDEEVRIIDIALLPHARRHGIGAAILEDLLEEAGEAAKAVSIHVEKNNPARGLYERLGFAPVRDRGVYDQREWRPAGAAPPDPGA